MTFKEDFPEEEGVGEHKPDDIQRPEKEVIHYQPVERREPEKPTLTEYAKRHLPALLISIVVVVVMSTIGLGNWVTKEVFEANINNLVKDIAAASTAATDSKNATDSAIQEFPKLISDQVNQSLGNTVSQINGQVTNLSNQVNNLQNRVDGFSNVDSGLVADIGENTGDIANLKTSVDKLNENYVDIQDDIDDIMERLVALEEIEKEEEADYSEDALSLEVSGVKIAEFDNSNHAVAYIEVSVYNDVDVDLDVDDIDFELMIQATPIPTNLEYTKLSYGTHYTETHYYAETIYVWRYNVNLTNLNYTIKDGQYRYCYK